MDLEDLVAEVLIPLRFSRCFSVEEEWVEAWEEA
jgi:hypothetical protein